MKNIFKLSTLFLGICASSVALASSAGAPATDKQLVAGYNTIVATTDIKNASQNFNIKPIADRAGFVKNEFQVTVSANVGLGANDDNTAGFVGQRFAVVAGSNRGRAVFTGTSEGGSVAQCGELVAKDTPNGGASLVVEGRIDYTKVNGCGAPAP